MTRREFDEEINSFDDLLNFCNDNNIYELEDVIDSESLDEYIWEEIRDFTGTWEDLRDRLYDIETGYSWYRRDGWLEYVYLDEDDFYRYKSDVIERADDLGIWDDEDQAEDDDEHPFADEELKELEEEAEKRRAGYYFRDPLTGEIFVAGFSYAPVNSGELDSLFS